MKKLQLLLLTLLIPFLGYTQINTFPWTHDFENYVGLEQDNKSVDSKIKLKLQLNYDDNGTKYDIEHLFNKFIHVYDRVNNMMRNMQYDRSRLIHLLLCIMQKNDRLDLNDKQKRLLSLYMMLKLTKNHDLFEESEQEKLFNLLYQVSVYLVEVSRGNNYTNYKPTNTKYVEPNIITYSTFEYFDNEMEENHGFELMEVIVRVLNVVHNYKCLRIEEKKYISIQVVNMLLEKYNTNDDVELIRELMPDLIDALMDVAKDTYLLKESRIANLPKKKWWQKMSCTT